MTKVEVKDPRGRTVQVETDGRTVWVHNWLGLTIGRFSSKGIDVHSSGATHCLDCRPGANPWGKPLKSEWKAFLASMKKYFEVEIPEDVLTSFVDEGAEEAILEASRFQEIETMNE